MKIKVFEAFCGYGSQAMALERIKNDVVDFDYEVVGVSDIDKNALNAYATIHGHCPNFGDISSINWQQVPDFDLFTYSFPCTSISYIGKNNGFTKGSGTASSLLWECQRAIETKKPKYLLMENVKSLVGKKYIEEFRQWINILESYGYKNYYKVLDAADYNTPQHRERVFCLGFKKKTKFNFPAPIDLEYIMYDFLEDYVQTKYFLKEKGIKFVTSHKNRDKSYTQINGDIQLCQKRNQQFNWHGDFVYHPVAEGEVFEEG